MFSFMKNKQRKFSFFYHYYYFKHSIEVQCSGLLMAMSSLIYSIVHSP